MKPASTTDVELLGVPFDANSSYLRGPAEAPERIREALFSGASNLSAEDGTDLAQRLHDGSDVAFDDDDDFRPPIERAVAAILDRGRRPLVLGGDHSITWPVVRAMSRAHPGLELVLFDAHPDLYDTFDGSRTSHACPFARIMEEGLVRRLVQLGIRAMNPHQRDQAKRFGVEVIEMRRLAGAGRLAFEGPVYLSVDLDVLDPAHAPGVSHREPGGMTTRELLDAVAELRGDLVGADLVELNPRRDPAGVSSAVAAKLVKELATRLISR